MPSITVTLPVRNLRVSAAFYAGLGFALSPEASAPDTVRMMIDRNISVLLMRAARYRDLVSDDADCAGSGAEALLCLSASSEREVDAIMVKAIIAGATPWPIADDQPACSGSFLDPDGHLWQVACPREHSRAEPAAAAVIAA